MEFVGSRLESASESDYGNSEEEEEDDGNQSLNHSPSDDDAPDFAQSRPISERYPPPRGLIGVFEEMLREGGPGITEPLILGKNNRGNDIIFPASKKYEDYLLIDSASMNNMTEGVPRAIEDIGTLNRRVLGEIYPKNDVAKLRSWYRWNGDTIEPAPKLADMVSDADIALENEYQLQQNELEKHFCDNFSVQFRRMPKTSGFEKSDVTGKKLLGFFGWEHGRTAQHERKYYLTFQRQIQSERTKPVGE